MRGGTPVRQAPQGDQAEVRSTPLEYRPPRRFCRTDSLSSMRQGPGGTCRTPQRRRSVDRPPCRGRTASIGCYVRGPLRIASRSFVVIDDGACAAPAHLSGIFHQSGCAPRLLRAPRHASPCAGRVIGRGIEALPALITLVLSPRAPAAAVRSRTAARRTPSPACFSGSSRAAAAAASSASPGRGRGGATVHPRHA
jgi:hypothetical protein